MTFQRITRREERKIFFVFWFLVFFSQKNKNNDKSISSLLYLFFCFTVFLVFHSFFVVSFPVLDIFCFPFFVVSFPVLDIFCFLFFLTLLLILSFWCWLWSIFYRGVSLFRFLRNNWFLWFDRLGRGFRLRGEFWFFYRRRGFNVNKSISRVFMTS